MRAVILIFGFGLALLSCKKDGANAECTSELDLSNVDQELLQSGQDEIDAYIEEKSILINEEVMGMKYTVVKRGSGESPNELCDKVVVGYQGKLLSNGKVFDQNSQTTFTLEQLIIGWQIGILEMNVGDKIVLYVPSEYAYGEEGRSDSDGNTVIPPNASLIFDIELYGTY